MRVMVRCRPLSEAETAAKLRSVVTVVQNVKQIEIHDPKTSGNNSAKTFSFDSVFDSSSTQEEVTESILQEGTIVVIVFLA